VGNHVEVPAAIAQVFITDELLRRPAPPPDYLREKLAIQDLAAQMANDPGEVLPHLVSLAMEICGADSAGISVLEGSHFRWFNLTGSLAVFENATTPRHFSPCGICLDQSRPILMERPERVYGWIADARISVPEVLLVPLLVNGKPLGTLWVVAKEGSHFDSGHARVMTELAAFTGVALRMIQSEVELKRTLEAQERLTQEMSHRIKNLFAIAEGMVRMTARGAGTKDELVKTLSGRLHALATANDLVRRHGAKISSIEFADVIRTVLRPYREAVLNGPRVDLSERAVNEIALIVHELATNAAKYGALSVDGGAVDIAWSTADDKLSFRWDETGGPATAAPVSKGFGTTLVDTTIAGFGGTIEREWTPDGLRVHVTVPQSAIAL
jgi:two-component sensor histidine kinase